MVFMKKGGGKKVPGGGGKTKGRPAAAKSKSAGGASAASAAATKRASSASGHNPFDVRGNSRSKYEVIGRRVKGQGRNVADARAAAEAKRRKTLGAQFQARNKANAFRDRRLGEQDASMSLEDKMMARFQSERKRKMRNASAFALHDSDDEGDEGDDLFLTHRGARIDDYDTLNDDGALEPDDIDDAHSREMDREIVNKLHFGGGGAGAAGDGAEGGEDGRKKSHKEVMQEVMLKAKMYKAERQKNKSAQEESTDQLDEGFADIRELLEFRPTRANGKELPDKGPMDEFDKLTREFAFEAKAKATERRMSPEEAAQRERDRLAELEKKRVARMQGDDDDSDSDDGGGGKKRGKKGGRKDKKGGKKAKTPQLILMPPTDDDLSSDYALDPRFGGAAQHDEDDEEDDGEDAEDDNAEEEEDEEEDSEAESGDDDDDDEDEEEDEDEETAQKDESDDDDEEDDEDDAEEKQRKRQEAAEELPFVFPCPESPEDLAALFKAHAKGSAANRSLIVERVLTYYSPRLSVENQSKMKSFFAILVRQFLKWAAHYALHRDDLDALARHMYALAQQLGDAAGVVVRELLINLFKRLHAAKARSKWPELPELLLFRALVQIFPTSDLRHNVVSPLETLLGESLVSGALETRQDAVQALFACTLALQITREKQRFTPEVLVCVKRLLRAFVGSGSNPSAPVHALRAELLAWVAAEGGGEGPLTLPRLQLTAASSASAGAILHGVLGVVRLASAQYAHLASFDELLHPVYLLLHEVSRSAFGGVRSAEVNAAIASVAAQLETCWAARAPLRLQSFAPAVLPTFTPKFDENYTLRKDRGADRDKAKLKQLQRQVKRARKGAARELRRDAEFLAREKHDEEAARVAAKRDKQKEIRRWLEEQNATFNQQVKKGGNMLKGGGSGPAKNRRVSKKQK